MISLDAGFLEKQGRSPILRGAGTADARRSRVLVEPLSWHCLASSGLDISITTTEPDLKQTWENHIQHSKEPITFALAPALRNVLQ